MRPADSSRPSPASSGLAQSPSHRPAPLHAGPEPIPTVRELVRASLFQSAPLRWPAFRRAIPKTIDFIVTLLGWFQVWAEQTAARKVQPFAKPRLFPTVTAGRSLRERRFGGHRVHERALDRGAGRRSTAGNPRSIASGQISAGRSRARRDQPEEAADADLCRPIERQLEGARSARPANTTRSPSGAGRCSGYRLHPAIEERMGC